MIDFIQMLINGVAVGSSYALLGLAMVIIYKTSEVPNFAQGEMALISTYVAYMLLEQYQFPSYMAFPLSLVFAAVLGGVL
jgi:branched-chain amino acid transport system permease protein